MAKIGNLYPLRMSKSVPGSSKDILGVLTYDLINFESVESLIDVIHINYYKSLSFITM